MNYGITATLAATLLMGGAAVAQTGTAPNSTSTPPKAPSTGMSTTGTTAPSIGATSQPAPQRSDSAAPAAVTTTTVPSRTTQAPVAGANSFTEGQARSRIEDKGFTSVTDLKKDDQGVWRATAQKDGKSVSVALDYQGNIVGQ